MKVFTIFILIIMGILVFFTIWGFNIVPKQMEFTDKCVRTCIDKNMSSEVNFQSLPWDNVNGECICKLTLKQNDAKDKLNARGDKNG